MSRTYRRQAGNAAIGRTDVLCEDGYDEEAGCWRPRYIDRHSPEGKKALARYCSDANVTMAMPPPKDFRLAYQKALRQSYRQAIHRWWREPDCEPLCQANHRHSAAYAWW